VRDPDKAVWHMYERDLRAEDKSARTIANYWYALSSLSETLPAGTDLLSATREQVAGWLAGVGARLARSTHATYSVNARTFYTHMAGAGYLEGPHPMRGLAAPDRGDTLMRCPPREEITAVIAACEGRDWRDRRDMAMVRILCEAGTPRASELAALPLDAPDMRRDSLRIAGKGNLERMIPLGAKSCRAITLWTRARAGRPPAARPGTRDLLFFTQFGAMTKDTVRRIITARCQAAGIDPIPPHAFRRYTYDAWDVLDGNEGAAMQLWGWRTSEMPRLYGRQNAGRRAVGHARAISLGDRV
jgi:site-specific recombinase XerD